jgi:hypothetical protein
VPAKDQEKLYKFIKELRGHILDDRSRKRLGIDLKDIMLVPTRSVKRLIVVYGDLTMLADSGGFLCSCVLVVLLERFGWLNLAAHECEQNLRFLISATLTPSGTSMTLKQFWQRFGS